jgi:hypothetical protein
MDRQRAAASDVHRRGHGVANRQQGFSAFLLGRCQVVRLPTAVSLVFGGQTIAVATEFEPVAGEVGAYTIRFFEEPAPPLPLNLLVYHEIELCFDGLDGPAKCAHVTTTAVMESAVEGTGTQVQFPPSGDAYQSVDVPVAPKGMVLPRDGTPLALCFRHGMVGYNYSIRASDL